MHFVTMAHQLAWMEQFNRKGKYHENQMENFIGWSINFGSQFSFWSVRCNDRNRKRNDRNRKRDDRHGKYENWKHRIWNRNNGKSRQYEYPNFKQPANRLQSQNHEGCIRKKM